MRTISILTVMAITSTVLSYHFMQEDTASKQPQSLTSQSRASFSLEVQDRLDKLASVLQHYQQTNQEQLRQAKFQQDRINRMLANLDTRIQSVETVDDEQATDSDVSDSDAKKPKALRISEGDFGHWMNETLHTGYLDRDSTKLATDQAGKTLEKESGIDLEDMQCGDGFCRATFVHEKGEQPDISSLFGAPPFLNEGFTVQEPDGRVVLYFNRPGESLKELRSEAREAILQNSDLGET